MLRELRLKNFAVVESVSVSFDSGLNVLTGETGAGKSILIDAIVLVRPHQEELFGYDAANGKLLWRFDLDDGERITEVGGVALVQRAARR